jgi:diguanylate cyclase (GGDEF)-like protein/PAS domain S-box-containing protein
MQIPAFPANEAERVAALWATRILDTPPEQTYDRVTRLAANVLNTPVALISLVDNKRQWFKSRLGLDLSETPREVSFCAHALLGSGAFVINDTLADPRFADNPLVTGSPNVRFYIGIPLRSVDGYALGTLCCIDYVPRRPTESEMSALRDLAGTAEELLQQRQAAAAAADLLLSLREREARYRQLIEQAPSAFLIHSDGVLKFINNAGLLLLGADRPEQLVGQSIASIVAPEYLEIARQRAKRVIDEGMSSPLLEQEWVRLDGTRVSVEVTSIPFTIGQNRAVQVIARNMTDSKREKLELERLSTNDMLTGLPNRTLLMDRLRQGISRWERQQQKSVIAFLDLDHFKAINDMFGHSAGDQALLAFARNLGLCVRQSDTAARIGGDQFVLVLEDIQDEEIPPHILQRMFDQISQPVWISNQEIPIGCSIGFCRYPDDGRDADTLLNAAEAAMHRAKELGRANIQKYQQDMRVQAGERLLLESQLRHAVERNELVLHYQPKVNLVTGRIVGVEALIRWQHPVLGMISPARFIPIAEESGLIAPIGEWIIRTACDQVRLWQHMQVTDISIAINLSSRQFLQQNIVGSIKQAIDSTGINPQLLEFELTESMAMGNPEKSISIMRQLKELGVSLSVDDFGTGYSNLSHLKRFPVDKLKIDRSFVGDITESSEALAIVQAIIAMAHNLHLTVVAEGVETAEQLSLLAHYQCEEMQGFYFCRPLPADACTAFIRSAPCLQISRFDPASVATTAKRHLAMRL